MPFSSEIKNFRLSCLMNQTEFGNALGVSFTTVNRWEKGKARPNTKAMVALHWEKYMEHIVQKYNKIYRIQMPKVTPHVCRHTFCSNMAKSGMNPKTLQYIMGHADISVTLNTYTHVKFDDAKDELIRVANA